MSCLLLTFFVFHVFPFFLLTLLVLAGKIIIFAGEIPIFHFFCWLNPMVHYYLMVQFQFVTTFSWWKSNFFTILVGEIQCSPMKSLLFTHRWPLPRPSAPLPGRRPRRWLPQLPSGGLQERRSHRLSPGARPPSLGYQKMEEKSTENPTFFFHGPCDNPRKIYVILMVNIGWSWKSMVEAHLVHDLRGPLEKNYSYGTIARG